MKHSEHDAGQSGKGEKSDGLPDAIKRNTLCLQHMVAIKMCRMIGRLEDILLDYRSPSVEHYCQELLQKDSTSATLEAIQAIRAEITARRDR